MKKAFVGWKEEWWIARKEWKLDIRADCHNRYRLWVKVWQAWRQYVKLEQNEKCLLTKAILYCKSYMFYLTYCGYVCVRIT